MDGKEIKMGILLALTKNVFCTELLGILMVGSGWAASFSVWVSTTNGTVRVDADDPLSEMSDWKCVHCGVALF